MREWAKLRKVPKLPTGAALPRRNGRSLTRRQKRCKKRQKDTYRLLLLLLLLVSDVRTMTGVPRRPVYGLIVSAERQLSAPELSVDPWRPVFSFLIIVMLPAAPQDGDAPAKCGDGGLLSGSSTRAGKGTSTASSGPWASRGETHRRCGGRELELEVKKRNECATGRRVATGEVWGLGFGVGVVR